MRTVIELFAGCGGAAVGIRDAGTSHLAAVEINPVCCQTLVQAGFPAVWVDAFDYVMPFEAWMLWASPPCQPYSRNGKRLGTADARDCWQAVYAAVKSNPMWVVIENVIGSPVGDWKSSLESLYKRVTHFRLNSRDFGVPQNRRREFIIAGPNEIKGIETSEPVTVSQSITSLLGKWIREEQRGAKAINADTQQCGTLTTKRNTYVHDRNPGARSGSGLYRLQGPPWGPRILSNEEASKIQGFPDGYRFAGNLTQQRAQIGNAVSPPVAKAIVSSIIQSELGTNLST